jgi:protocatechuate 3,4-dioxygenase beta subunit
MIKQMPSSVEKEKDIMTRTIYGTAILAALLLNQCSRADASPRLPSRIVIAGPSEPGQRLIVTGRVVDANGKPRAGVIIEAHHTDANGIYLAEGAHGPNPDVAARLWGRLATADDGSYRIETIRPGEYPGGGAPAHIHMHIRDGRNSHWEILEFADDPNLTPLMRARDGRGGTFAAIRPLQRDSAGVWHCTRDFRAGGAQ